MVHVVFPSIVRFIAFFLPESPRWLVGRGKVYSAGEECAPETEGEEAQVEELGEIQKDMKCSAKENE